MMASYTFKVQEELDLDTEMNSFPLVSLSLIGGLFLC